MAKPTDNKEKESVWGTWEELLLACAVNWLGIKSWDLVAMEIQKRSSSFNILTAQNCKQKYHDLKRRFTAKDDKTDDEEDESESKSETDDKIDGIPWLDELRKLRMEELRREVERYDVSIVSLQLKVKKLENEREENLRENQNRELTPDLDASEKDIAEDEKKSSPENVFGKSICGEESDRENQSFNESNSTDPKSEKETDEKKTEPVDTDHTVAVKSDPVPADSKPVGEGSYNGSSDTIAKDSVATPVTNSSRPILAREAEDSPELWESVAESKGGEDGTKENSDVQSSASLSRKKRREKEEDEQETDEVSPAITRISVKSEPLDRFLEVIRSHKYGFVFERRLESQESANYRSLIRQHVDLETVRTRLEDENNSSCSRKFFRDLLLLFNNALVFFPKDSPESVAANELRELVSKEMVKRIIQVQISDKSSPEASPPFRPLSKPDQVPSDSLLVKHKSSGPVIVSRKRSSISAKGSSGRRVDPKAVELNEGKSVPDPDPKQSDDYSLNAVEERSIKKKRTGERSASGVRSSRARINTNRNEVSSENLNPDSKLGLARKVRSAPEVNLDPKIQRKNHDNTDAIAKKRGAANFLSRMKRNSSSNGTPSDTMKNSVDSKNNNNNSIKNKVSTGEEAEHRKSGGGRSDARRDQVLRRASGGKQAQEQGSPAKRSVGRPPKRAAATTSAPPLSASQSKRAREKVETRSSRKR